MKEWILLAGILFCTNITAQEQQKTKFSKEFSLVSDDDAYLLQRKDKYYTAGTFFTLNVAKEKKGRKKIIAYELGQMIYTPLKPINSSNNTIDRPFCGYLYLKYAESIFTQKDAFINYSIALGTLGGYSYAENTQLFVHQLFGLYHFTGWQYQIGNSAELNSNVNYAQTIIVDNKENPSFKIVPFIQLNLGTTFTNARLGTYFCLGAFEKNSNSALFNAGINKKRIPTKRNHELFFYFYPQLTMQGYDATIQGSLSGNSNSHAVTSFTNPFMYQQNLGFVYAQNRWSTKIEFIYQTKECSTQTLSQHYGSLKLSYRFN
jgi:hypothetical protein